MSREAVKQIYDRHRNELENPYIEIFSGDDRKSGKKPYSKFFNLSKSSVDDLISESEIYNTGVYGVFLNINPLKNSRRLKENVSKILYVFIDLDDAKEDHNLLVIDNLKKLEISYSYNAKSGSGYHILVPVDLDVSYESKIKGFLNYLKENICSKVDLATADLGRLMRFPSSFHNKYDESIQLKTLYNSIPKEDEIKSNSENILKYQIEQKKGEKDLEYQKSIKRKDIFFSKILTKRKKHDKYIEYLENSTDRNNIFVKNLGIFVKDNPEYSIEANNFLSKWEPSRIDALKGWEKKAQEENYTINYFEILNWSKKYELEDFTYLLELQLRTSFLDKYEFYYLEAEKKENSHLMYYPDRDYYVNKSLNEILMNVYYDCLERGIDLVKTFSLDEVVNKWDEMSFSKQLTIILNSIHKKIINERRLKTVYNVNYAPIDDKFFYFEKKKFFNIYTKTDLWDYNNKESKFQFQYIKELLMNLAGNDAKNYEFLNKWLAWIVQNPTEKLPTAIILQGRQGSGKGTFKNLILDNIFGNNCQEINQTHLENSFNEYLFGKQIIVANEVMHNENRQTLPNVLKNYVTDEYITISRKYKTEVVCRNYTHWVFCTNNDNPLKIDEDDRRYIVFYSEKLRKGLAKEIRKNLDYELKEYISYLKSLSVDFEEVSEPIMTEAKEEIIELNKDSLQRFVEYIKKFRDIHTLALTFPKKEFSTNTEEVSGKEFIPTDIFYLCYEQYCKKFDEKGKFNKQTFCKKIKRYDIISQIVYIPDKKKSMKMYDLQDIHSLMEAQV